MAAAPKVDPPAPRPKGHPPVQIREQLANGVKFVQDTTSKGPCIACGGFGEDDHRLVDKSTGLGPRCWQAWRWSPKAEFGIAGSP